MQKYIIQSLELHLFFARIMKEHAFFLEVGYTEAAADFRKEAKSFKEAFEDLLCQVVKCSFGVITSDAKKSGEIMTEYTLCSEKATRELTGAMLDSGITQMESKLVNSCDDCRNNVDNGSVNEVREINDRALQLLDCFIEFKEATLRNVLDCRMFTMNYPLLIEHIIREAKLYRNYVCNLEHGTPCKRENLQQEETFWNQIMMEHALFIRGLLDPTEGDLIKASNQFAGDYAQLLKQSRDMTDRTMKGITEETLAKTIEYRDFKTAGAKGINDCEVRSLILPLLADHVLREANHYIRILKNE